MKNGRKRTSGRFFVRCAGLVRRRARRTGGAGRNRAGTCCRRPGTTGSARRTSYSDLPPAGRGGAARRPAVLRSRADDRPVRHTRTRYEVGAGSAAGGGDDGAGASACRRRVHAIRGDDRGASHDGRRAIDAGPTGPAPARHHCRTERQWTGQGPRPRRWPVPRRPARGQERRQGGLPIISLSCESPANIPRPVNPWPENGEIHMNRR